MPVAQTVTEWSYVWYSHKQEARVHATDGSRLGLGEHCDQMRSDSENTLTAHERGFAGVPTWHVDNDGEEFGLRNWRAGADRS